jgi:hypothetical protein
VVFSRLNTIAFLRVVDAQITRPGVVCLVGGAAIGLAYVSSYKTRDVDYVWADREVHEAIREISASRPDLIPAMHTGVYFAPDTYEDRLEFLGVPGLKRLRVAIPERHDLAIMKITRGFERDIGAVVEMHSCAELDFRVLVERYAETWTTGSQQLADAGFRDALSILFGDADAETGMEMLARLRDRGLSGASKTRRLPTRRRGTPK